MQRIVKVLIAIAALGLAGWFGYQAIFGNKPVSAVLGISAEAGDGLPDSPEEWRGRIDYRQLDRQLSALSSRPEMAGLAVAVIEDGKLSFVRTYGVVDRSTNIAVTPETVFRWASVSKTVTGALAATLASENALDLEAPIANWQTTLRLPDAAESRVTLAQLLSHQTGLTKNAYDEKLEDGESPGLLRARLADAPLQCPPGTCHTYQNIAFDAASEILSQAASRPFTNATSERFFLPLGMGSANYGMAGLTGAKSWARPHSDQEVRTLREAYWRVPAAAGVNSNILDFARWMQAVMGERPDVLPTSVLRIVQIPRVETARLYGGALKQANSDAKYGLGWRSITYAGHRIVGHSGAVDGYRATLMFDAATRTGVVAMWNSNWGAPFRIPFAVIDSYYKRGGVSWLDLSDIPLPQSEPAAAPTR